MHTRDFFSGIERIIGESNFAFCCRVLICILRIPFSEFADKLTLVVAEIFFENGCYPAALRYAESVRGPRYLEDAVYLSSWIRYKSDGFAKGWPRYPGGLFDPKGLEYDQPNAATVYIENANKPDELIRCLGFRPWTPTVTSPKPIFIWYDCASSLGGETLATLLLLRFKRQFQVKLILVADPRLLEVVRTNFPLDEVYAKGKNLAEFRQRCDNYLLARDVLMYVIQSESDFAELQKETLKLAGSPNQLASSHRPQVAFSWKTTNLKQGFYRNLPIKKLAKLFAKFDCDYHSAQHAVKTESITLLKGILGDRIHFDTIHPSGTAEDIARALAAMDLVITIDNSVLHIAGAFGVPTIALLSVPAYWAWPMEGKSSRFYHSVQLIHQKKPREWDDVLAELTPILAQLRVRQRPIR